MIRKTLTLGLVVATAALLVGPITGCAEEKPTVEIHEHYYDAPPPPPVTTEYHRETVIVEEPATETETHTYESHEVIGSSPGEPIVE